MGLDLGNIANAFGAGAITGLIERDWSRRDAADARQANERASQAQMDFQERMSNTAYQRAVKDLEAAGLNPMISLMHGGASTPGGSALQAPMPRATHAFNPAVATTAANIQRTEAETRNIEQQTEVAKATENEIIARTPTHAVNIERMQQDIRESLERIEKLRQDVKVGAATAAHLDQQVRNLQETIPQIHATTRQLQALAKLNDAQAIERLAQAGVHREHAKEIIQRVRQDLPALQRQLDDLERVARLMQQPGQMADEAAKSSFIGTLGAYMRALLPLEGIMGAIPLGRVGASPAPRTPSIPPMIGQPGRRP